MLHHRRNASSSSLAGHLSQPQILDAKQIQRLKELAQTSSHPQYGVKEVTEEAWVITKLAFLLLRFLMGSYRWIVRVLRLLAFVLLLLPALSKMTYDILRAPHILRDIRYGPHARNFLDIYLPPMRPGRSKGQRYPVTVFFTGGAWTIGYKLWSGMFSDAFLEKEILYVTPDYRNFPQGYGNEMAEDVEHAIAWVIQNIELYGGDPKNITVVGQSAGAHLASFVLLRKATEEWEARVRHENEAHNRGDVPCLNHTELEPNNEKMRNEIETGIGKPRWSTKQIRQFIGVGGPYDLASYVGYLHSRGLPSYLLYSIFQGELSRFSPTRIAKELTKKLDKLAHSSKAAFMFPPTILVHGTADVTMPSQASVDFGQALKDIGVMVDVELHLGKTHTDCILEDIFLGNNVMLDSIVQAILKDDGSCMEVMPHGSEQEQEVGSCNDSSSSSSSSPSGMLSEVLAASTATVEAAVEAAELGKESLHGAEITWRRLAPAYYPTFLVRTAQRVNPF